jgi:hypothetical protein
MTGVAHLSAAQCEDLFNAALAEGDARGVEAALTLLAVRDPHRAQVLLNSVRLALAVTRSGREEGTAA